MNIMTGELITVVLPVYNGMPFLPEAVDSILAQTLKNFRLLVIDDGSTDDSADYLERIKDTRAMVLHQENQGLGATLNRAIELCQTKYMVRMDSDDVMAPNRLEEQLKYMEEHEDIVVLGTQLAFIAGERTIRAPKVPIEHEDIEGRLMIGKAGLCHPSLMLRTQDIKATGGYRISGAGQDIDFCLRLCEIGRVANLDRVLHYYRIHENSAALNKQEELRCAYAYGIECAKCRRRSLGEPRLDKFVQMWEKRSRLTKILNKIEDWSTWQYRRSILDKGQGKTIRSAARFACAAAARPRYSLKKLMGRW